MKTPHLDEALAAMTAHSKALREEADRIDALRSQLEDSEDPIPEDPLPEKPKPANTVRKKPEPTGALHDQINSAVLGVLKDAEGAMKPKDIFHKCSLNLPPKVNSSRLSRWLSEHAETGLIVKEKPNRTTTLYRLP